MIATDQFVYIHQPKTGGTFVTTVLKELSDLLGTTELRVRRAENPFVKAKVKHGHARHILREHRHKTILSTVRNPYDMYVSEYEFGWWKRPEYPTYFRRLVPGFRKKYATFPALSFEDFVRLYNSAFCFRPSGRRFENAHGLGWLTERFVKFYYRNPWWALWKLDADNVTWEHVHSATPKIHFLRTERLNQGLYEFLRELGYPEERLQFILDKARVLPGGKGRTADQKWQSYYTPEFLRHIRQRERFLFQLFPEYDKSGEPADHGAAAAP